MLQKSVYWPVLAASWLRGKLLEAIRARLVLSPVTVAAAVRVRDICHALCAPQVCQPPVLPAAGRGVLSLGENTGLCQQWQRYKLMLWPQGVV
jgi:hypothetical protein